MTMNELEQFAAKEQMIPKAPIEAACSVEISAPSNKVWSILTGVSHWERWYPYLKKAKLKGPFSAQTSLTYGGFVKHRLRIAKVVPGELVMLYGTMAGYKGDHAVEREAFRRNSDRSFVYGIFFRLSHRHLVQQSKVEGTSYVLAERIESASRAFEVIPARPELKRASGMGPPKLHLRQ